MIIIEKKDLDLYRYSVAKIIFLKVYEEYSFLEDVKGSPFVNCAKNYFINHNVTPLVLSYFQYKQFRLAISYI